MQYLNYLQLTEKLHELDKAFGPYSELSSLGKSPEGREIWLFKIRPNNDQEIYPAVWVDANIHAGELLGSVISIDLIEQVLNIKTSSEKEFHNFINEKMIYIVPRISPDGAEYCINNQTFLRSAPRNFPHNKIAEGIIPQDINGNGEISQMRVQSDYGDWSVSSEDPRIMVPRLPGMKGPFYFLFQEGLLTDEDFLRMNNSAPAMGLDLNRNFSRHFEKGPFDNYGRFPMDQPETRAICEFIVNHPNICSAMSLHTFGRVLLYAPCNIKSKSGFAASDYMMIYNISKHLAEKGGLSALNFYDDFRYDDGPGLFGSMMDWLYDDLGILPMVAELWSLPAEAGLDTTEAKQLYGGFSEKEEKKILDYLDQNEKIPENTYFREWKSFEHPQLGNVEIGGIRTLYCWSNPPHSLLENEVKRTRQAMLDFTELCPKIKILARSKSYKEVIVLEIRVESTGFLPTFGLQKHKDLFKQDQIEIEIFSSLEEIGNPGKQKLGHLHGYGNINNSYFTSPKYRVGPIGPRANQQSWSFLKGENDPVFKMKLNSRKLGVRVREIPITEDWTEI